jgi:hypothetical protein
LEVHPWADERNAKERQRRGAILREDWRAKFSEFVRRVGSTEVYVTIDLDCLRAEDAATNWENGRFTVEDLTWALRLLGDRIAAGDICGAWSTPIYARRKQRFAANFDHPKLPERSFVERQETNLAALRQLLTALEPNAS